VTFWNPLLGCVEWEPVRAGVIVRGFPATDATVERGRPVPAYPARVTVHAPGVITCPAQLDAIAVEAWGRYPDRRSLPDADAIAPALKGFLDGLVDAGLVVDDSGSYVHKITYCAPVVGAGQPAALVVRVTEVAS
jgi:hypothetical protein